ncbi:hypothetical protein [Microbispora bryophytorum]|uniref:hypothetical protein n=1 Tax=Microbispora bryophytorum TaxID=1460882 RepID=UPI0033EDA398
MTHDPKNEPDSIETRGREFGRRIARMSTRELIEMFGEIRKRAADRPTEDREESDQS